MDFFEELPRTALLYRGGAYAAAASAPKASVELTYRREHNNTCREVVARDVHPTLTYRSVSYTKKAEASFRPCPCHWRGPLAGWLTTIQAGFRHCVRDRFKALQWERTSSPS
ncbi:DUF4278 domain-containing protein [Synechococcus sp. MU1643]|nr:DUF4278 domain-containing protein [Synechococcus sp. MU1643]MCB4428691.1 DUF4278 domain-containing protein [Synechococcus sp. MU1643]